MSVVRSCDECGNRIVLVGDRWELRRPDTGFSPGTQFTWEFCSLQCVMLWSDHSAIALRLRVPTPASVPGVPEEEPK